MIDNHIIDRPLQEKMKLTRMDVAVLHDFRTKLTPVDVALLREFRMTKLTPVDVALPREFRMTKLTHMYIAFLREFRMTKLTHMYIALLREFRMTKLTHMYIALLREFQVTRPIHMDIVPLRGFHHARDRTQEVRQSLLGRMMAAAMRARWFLSYLQVAMSSRQVTILMCTLTQRLSDLMTPLIGSTNDWTKQNANSNGLFTTLMKLKTVVKKNSDTMKMEENKSFFKMKIAVRLRQDSVVTSYLLNWKRGRTVYLLYPSLLHLDLGTMLQSLNRFTQPLMRRLLAMPLTFWTRFGLNESSLLMKGIL
jgi:hypothetical protein